MIRSLRKRDLKIVEINIVVLTILLYLFRTTVPVLKFLFILLFFGLLLYSIINYRSRIRLTFKNLFYNFYLSIILLIILIVSFLLSNKIYLVLDIIWFLKNHFKLGKYNLILNQDVYFQKKVLMELFLIMEKHSEIGMITPKY